MTHSRIPRRSLLGSIALSALCATGATDAASVAHAGSASCGTPVPVSSSVKCHAPRDCGTGQTIDVGKFQVGLGAETNGDECCRVLEFIPAHNDKSNVPEYEVFSSTVEGWTKVGECVPGTLSILGVISIPLGFRTCKYGESMPLAVLTYEADGYCEDSSTP